MKFNKGDILICSNNKLYNKDYLIIGDKYEVMDNFNSSISLLGNDRELIIDVRHIKTGTIISLVSYKLFITLEVYREFKLREIGI